MCLCLVQWSDGSWDQRHYGTHGRWKDNVRIFDVHYPLHSKNTFVTVTYNMLNNRNDIHFCHFNTKGKICVFAVCAVY